MAISGEPIDLLTGSTREMLGSVERAAREQREAQKAHVQQQLEKHLNSPDLLSSAAAVQLSFGDELQRFREAAERVAATKLEILRKPDAELIDLGNAQCTVKADGAMIRGKIRSSEGEVTRLVVGLIRDNVCGIGGVSADARRSPGSLALSLEETVLDLGKMPSFEGSPLLLLQFAGWLRLRPKVQQLTVPASHISPDGTALLRQAFEDGLLEGLQKLILNPYDVTPELRELATAIADGPRALPGEQGSLTNMPSSTSRRQLLSRMQSWASGPLWLGRRKQPVTVVGPATSTTSMHEAGSSLTNAAVDAQEIL